MTEDELIEQMKDFRRKRSNHRARAILNTASLALGGRGLTPRENPEVQKAKLREPLLEQLHGAETQQLEARTAQMEEHGRMVREQAKQAAENYRARLRAATEATRISQNAAEARARLHGQRLETEIARLDDRMSGLGQLDAENKARADAWLSSDASPLTRVIGHIQTLEGGENVDTVREAMAFMRKNPEVRQQYEAVVAQSLQGLGWGAMEADQQAGALDYLTQALDADVHTLGLGDLQQQFSREVDAERQEMERQLLILGKQWESVAGQTFGSTRQMQDLMSVGTQARELQSQAQQVTAQAQQQSAVTANDPDLSKSDEELVGSWDVNAPDQQQQSPTQMVANQQQQQGEFVRAQSAALSPQEQWQEEMGIRFDSPAEEQTRQALQAIDSMDTSPAHLRLKKQMMESPDFRSFMGNRGYNDPDFAFREFQREVMATARRRRADDRKARRENIKAGITTYSQGGRDSRAQVLPERNPVRGDTDTVV